MRNVHKQLEDVLRTTLELEDDIDPGLKQYDRVTQGLIDSTHTLVQIQDYVAEHADSIDGSEQIISFIGLCKRCNMHRIKILERINSKHADISDYSYESYREHAGELAELLEERREQMSTILYADAEWITDSEPHVTDGLRAEDALLIRILIAISKSDGKVHRKERKAIAKQYKNITGTAPDEAALKQCFDHPLDDISGELSDIKSRAEDIFPNVRQLMFSSAISVALADRHLYAEERHLLLDVAHALSIPTSDIPQIL